jgi:hypothetical protein
MSDPIPAVTRTKPVRLSRLLDPIRKRRDPHGWWACLFNGIVVRIAGDRESLIRYSRRDANDPVWRSIIPLTASFALETLSLI